MPRTPSNPPDWSPAIVGPYFKMYLHIFRIPNLNTVDRLVYCYLASLQQGKAVSHPSQPSIAQALSISTRSVRSAVLNLEKLNLLVVHRRRDESGRLHNVYSATDQLLADLHSSRRKAAHRSFQSLNPEANSALGHD